MVLLAHAATSPYLNQSINQIFVYWQEG